MSSSDGSAPRPSIAESTSVPWSTAVRTRPGTGLVRALTVRTAASFARTAARVADPGPGEDQPVRAAPAATIGSASGIMPAFSAAAAGAARAAVSGTPV